MLNRRTLLALAPALAASSSGAQAPRDRVPPLRRTFPDEGAVNWAWTDDARQRMLPLRLLRPAVLEPAPLVLFSHGLGGSVEAGRLWAQAWAAAGIATLNLQHPGSDSAVAHEGGLALRRAATWEQLKARGEDVRFVLDELARRQAAGDPDVAGLDLTRVGLAGHSFGAHTTLLIAGQRLGRRGFQLTDSRVRAFAAFSPSPGDERQGLRPSAFADIRRPLLCLTGSLDTDPMNPRSPRGQSGQWRRAVYDAVPNGDKAELWLDGADHMSFGGNPMTGPLAARRPAAAVQQAERHHALIAAVSTDWWRAQLRGDPPARARLAVPPEGLGSQDEWRRG